MLYTSFDSPVGRLVALGDGHALHGLYMQEGRTAIAIRPEWEGADDPFAELREQLSEYFDGHRQTFDLALETAGSPFQRRVWRALQEIPYGETVSYAELAARVGRPAAFRAVGAANGRNPIAIVIPCHRVIGANGSLTGFGGGLPIKGRLLALERAGSGLWRPQPSV